MAAPVEFDLDQLSPTQQEALHQYTQLTNQEPKDAVPLLERSQWNVQIAITKFFDGETADPVAEAAAAQPTPPRIQARQENLQDSFYAPSDNRPSRRGRIEDAPRVVPQPTTTYKPPFVLAILLAPIGVVMKLVTSLLQPLSYALSFLPISIRPQTITGQITRGLRNTNGRKMLFPRDTAARFRREFDEEYGPNTLPWLEDGFAQAHDQAKKDLKFLLVVFVSPEHDDTAQFTRETLLSPEVVAYINDPTNNMILWGGNILDSEAYTVSQEYQVTKFPFSALLCRAPKTSSGGSSVGLSVVKRLAGPMPAATYLQTLQATINRYAPDLETLRAEKIAQNSTRDLRNEQDSAYERSLAKDRERKRLALEKEKETAAAEKRAKDEAEAAEVRAEKKKQWRAWRASTIPPEPAMSDKDVVRLAVKLPERQGGQRLIRRFEARTTLEELYAFVECSDLLNSDAVSADNSSGAQTTMAKPDGYEHVYDFRIASVLPREVFGPSASITLGEKIGRSGNLIVEDGIED